MEPIAKFLATNDQLSVNEMLNAYANMNKSIVHDWTSHNCLPIVKFSTDYAIRIADNLAKALQFHISQGLIEMSKLIEHEKEFDTNKLTVSNFRLIMIAKTVALTLLDSNSLNIVPGRIKDAPAVVSFKRALKRNDPDIVAMFKTLLTTSYVPSLDLNHFHQKPSKVRTKCLCISMDI